MKRVNWNGTITICQGWRYITAILHIGDILIEYIFLHFKPTRSIYEFGIFTYGPICPSLSSVRRPAPVRARSSEPYPPPELILGVPTAGDRSRGGAAAIACLRPASRGARRPLPAALAGPCSGQ